MPIDIPLGTETAGYIVTIDGRTYRPVKLDSSGRLLAVEAFDRIDISRYDAYVGNHGDTVRWLYTVPSTERGKILWVFISISKLTTDESAIVFLYHDPAGAAAPTNFIQLHGRNTQIAVYQAQPMVSFTPGDVIGALSANNDGADRRFQIFVAFGVQAV